MNFQTKKLRELAKEINALPSFWRDWVVRDAVQLELSGYSRDVAFAKSLKQVLRDMNRK